MKYFVGVDLGGTNMRAAVLDLDKGELVASRSVPTRSREGHDAVLARMAELIRHTCTAMKGKVEIGGVGIGAPGMVDPLTGIVGFLPNLPGHWLNVSVCQVIQSQTGYPTHLLNDARAATLGEWAYGAGRGVDTMVCYTLGTGIGGGMVINGQLHLGINGTAGELGHMVVDVNGPLCGCGSHGCVETLASGPAIAAQGARALQQGLTTSIGEEVQYDLNRITPEIVFRAAQAGDVVALEIFERAGFYLGVGIANVITAISPKRVILAGGVAAAGNLIFDPVRKTVSERVRLVPVNQVEILPAELGGNAGLIGAAFWASKHC